MFDPPRSHSCLENLSHVGAERLALEGAPARRRKAQTGPKILGRELWLLGSKLHKFSESKSLPCQIRHVASQKRQRNNPAGAGDAWEFHPASPAKVVYCDLRSYPRTLETLRECGWCV